MLIFAQAREPNIDLVKLLNSARAHFEASIEVLAEFPVDAQAETGGARVRLTSARHGFSCDFELLTRRVTPDDLDLARSAEVRGKAAGMATLAERCAFVWVVSPQGESPAALLNLCALLASVALGPVLPDDGSTLFGVRGAMQRLETLLGTRSLLR